MFLAFLNPLRIANYFRLSVAMERYRKHPDQDETLAVARLLAKVGDRSGALSYLRNGRKRFPASPEIQQLYAKLWAQSAAAEIRSLERGWRSQPRVEDAARLVELHRSVRNFDVAIRTAEEAEAKFPDSWLLKLAVGKTLYHRFLVSRNAEDGKRAAEALRQARTIKSDCSRALVYLTALLAETGPRSDAIAAAEELARIAPHSTQAQSFRQKLTGASAASTAAPEAGPPAQTAADSDEELTSLLLAELRQIPEVCATIIFHPDGGPVRQHFVPNELFAAENCQQAVASLAAGLHGAAERMGIGRLNTCVVEGDPWWIYLAEVAGKSVVILARKGFKSSAFERLMNRFMTETVTL